MLFVQNIQEWISIWGLKCHLKSKPESTGTNINVAMQGQSFLHGQLKSDDEGCVKIECQQDSGEGFERQSLMFCLSFVFVYLMVLVICCQDDDDGGLSDLSFLSDAR